MQSVYQLSRSTRAWPVWARYVSTLGIVLAALGIRLVFDRWLAGYPLLLFYPAIVLCALAFDHGTSLFATALSAILIAYTFLPPSGFGIGAASDVVALIIFIALGVVMGAAIESAHRYLAELEVARGIAEQTAKENETLLREVAHRVQNNLQLLVSMLSVERRLGRYANPDELLESIIHRVRTMARLHVALFQRGGTGTVDARPFFEHFCADLRTGVIGGEPILLRCEAADARLRLDHAVTVGLIITELVTNAVKHAFKDKPSGEISVSLSTQNSRYVVTVADNGVGIRPVGPAGFGEQLIRVLTTQLRGELDVQSVPGQGAKVVITFLVPQELRR